jgi:hypothetical protein
MAYLQPHTDPVTVPPRVVVYTAAALVALTAVAGLGFGFKAGWRDGNRGPSSGSDQSQGIDTAVLAKPIVDIPSLEQQAPANAVASNAMADDSDQADNSVAAKTAAAQAIQSKPVATTPTLDDTEASPSERPQAPAKPSTDEGAPGAPTKSDVPF